MSSNTSSDMTEAIPFDTSFGLFLKPISKLKINIQLPKLSLPGQSISSWQVMEKLKEIVKPEIFLFLKTLKITTNIIKLEGEFETKSSSERALARLKAAACIKLSGFADKLQIHAALATNLGPTRHDWEAFFRDAKGVNEMKPGERPDTLHLEEMPIRWFSESGKSSVVSERILRRVFETFGKVRRLEILQNLPTTSSFTKPSSLLSDLLFEAYIQYEEYVEFSIAMDSLRGKKLIYKDPSGKVFSAYIKVNFDKNKYLSDSAIRRREAEKLRKSLSLKKKDEKLYKDNKHTSPDKTQAGPSSTTTKPIQDVKESSSKEESRNVPSQTQPSTVGEEQLKEAKLLIRELLLRAENRIRQSISALNKSKAPSQSSKNERQTQVIKKDVNTSDLHQKERRSVSEKHVSNSRTEDKSRSHDSKTSTSTTKRKHSVERDHSKKSENSYSNSKKHSSEEKFSKKHKRDSSYDKHKKRDSKRHSVERKKSNSKNEKSTEHKKPKKEKRQNNDKRTHVVNDDTVDEKRNKERLILQERILKEKLIRNLRAKEIEKMKCEDLDEISDQRILASVLSFTNDTVKDRS